MFDEPLSFDDFYADPDRIRRRALKLQFGRHLGANYPGLCSPTFQDLRPLMRRFSGILSGIRLTDHGIPQGFFRIALGDSHRTQRMNVHTDPTTWTAVIYLSRRSRCSGTLFYRHRKTRWTRIHWSGDPQYEEARRAGFFRTEKEMMACFSRDTKNPRAWEIVREVPMRYNRMVLFRGAFFHSPTLESFGDSPETGRLSQHFFFSPKPSRDCPFPDPHARRCFALMKPRDYLKRETPMFRSAR